MYDFDYEIYPMERKASGGKLQHSPVKDADGTRGREITPLRDMTRKLAPMSVVRVAAHGDTTTTDHTSENESSFSTTEDETTTDDQMMPVVRYNFGPPPVGFYSQSGLRQPESTSKLYDPPTFQRVDSSMSGSCEKPQTKPENEESYSVKNETTDVNNSADNDPGTLEEGESSGSNQKALSECAKEGPMPQVPSYPKSLQQTVRTAPGNEPSWPHGPPPPYSPADNKFTV